jgi:hypothetical protein
MKKYRPQAGVQKNEVENCQLSKSSGVDVKQCYGLSKAIKIGPSGTGSGGFCIIFMKIKVEWHSIIFCNLGSLFGLIFGEFTWNCLPSQVRNFQSTNLSLEGDCHVLDTTFHHKLMTYLEGDCHELDTTFHHKLMTYLEGANFSPKNFVKKLPPN